MPITKGANRLLFEEIDRYELTERCVSILKQLQKQKSSFKQRPNDSKKIFGNLFSFMGMGKLKVFFSPDINVVFVHNMSLFMPETELTRDFIVKVLNVCHSQVDGSSGETFSCLLQSIFEKIDNSTSTFDTAVASMVISRAKDVLKESINFVVKNDITSTTRPAEKSQSIDHTNTIISLHSVDDNISDDGETSSSNNQPLSMPTTFARIEEKIRNINQKVSENENMNSMIQGSAFENDNAGNDCCLQPSSSLIRMNVDDDLGSGSMWFDNTSASQIESGEFPVETKNAIFTLRKSLDEAKHIVRRSIPSLDTVLKRVIAGFDANNYTYYAFCNGSQIVMNLFSYIPKLSSTTLVHDLIITVTHEIAHFLEPRAGHGPDWRDSHMKMVIEVMKHFQGLK